MGHLALSAIAFATEQKLRSEKVEELMERGDTLFWGIWPSRESAAEVVFSFALAAAIVSSIGGPKAHRLSASKSNPPGSMNCRVP